MTRKNNLSLGVRVRIRTNLREFKLAPNSHEFVDPSELEFATSKSNSTRIRLNSRGAENPWVPTIYHPGCNPPLSIWICHYPVPYSINDFKSKGLHNLAIVVVACCLHSPCLKNLTKITTNQNQEFRISRYRPFLDSFKCLLEKKQQRSMQNHQSPHKPSHVNHLLPLLGLQSSSFLHLSNAFEP